MRKLEIIASIAFITFSTIMLKLSSAFPTPKGNDVGGSFFPRTLSVLLILLSLILLFNSIKKDKNNKQGTQNPINFHATICVSIVILLTVIYRYIIIYLGFLIITPIYLIILMILIKVENIARSIVLSISITVIIWFVFYYFLQMPLPNGILFQ